MEYQGYKTREELITLVEESFPYISRPNEVEFYAFDDSDLMHKIIKRGISEYPGNELPYEGVIALYDEFSSITNEAVQWLFPSLLRILIRGEDRSGNLHGSLVSYFEHCSSEAGSAYNFNWLTVTQVSTLLSVLEHLSEEYGEMVSLAQENLCAIHKT